MDLAIAILPTMSIAPSNLLHNIIMILTLPVECLRVGKITSNGTGKKIINFDKQANVISISKQVDMHV